MKGSLPPSIVPPEVRHDTPRPSRRTSRDFSRQLRTPRNVGQERTDEKKPKDARGIVEDAARTTVMTAVPLIQKGTDAVVLYAQSLHVVGYLSMLTHGRAGQNVLSPASMATTRAELPALVPSVAGVPAAVAENHESQRMADPSGPLAPIARASQTAGDPDGTTSYVAGSPALESRRFSRRFVKLAGTRLLLRDFSLNPAHLREVLEAFSSMTVAEGQPVTGAFINGTAYERTADGSTLTKKG